MKRLLLSLALATSLSLSAVAAEAPATDHIPAFQTKIVENGEPIAGKPGQLRDFLEMRHTRGFSKAALPDLNGKQVALDSFKGKFGVDRHMGELVRTVHPYDAGHARAAEEVQSRSQEPHPHSVRVGR